MFKNLLQNKEWENYVNNGYLWVTKPRVIFFSSPFLNLYNYHIFFILEKVTLNLKEENSLFLLNLN